MTSPSRAAKSFFIISILGAMFALCTSATVWAADPELPKGVGSLPDFSKGARSGVVVTAQHAHMYRALLPDAVAELVEQGEFSFEAARAPHEPERFEAEFGTSGELDPVGTLRKTPPAVPLPSSLFTVSEGSSDDQKRQAFKVLWNATASMWRYNSFAVGLSMYLFQRADSAPRKVQFSVERIHPTSLGDAAGTLVPVFREKISAQKPTAIEGLSWLTLRFFGPGEDFVWAASPVVRSIRQMTGSNRSDQIFSGAFTPDDLFVWSGKVELVEPQSISLVSLLVPTLDTKDAPPTKQEACLARVFSGESALTLQCQSSRFKGASGWIPSNTVMTVRRVWKIELTSRDPFSAEPRQTVYVDQSSGIPVYRVVWDQAGRRKRTSIGILRSIDVTPQERHVLLAGQVVVHAQDGRRLTLVYDSLTYCARYLPGRSAADFDPSTFVVFPKQPPSDKKLADVAKSEDSFD